jgi:hypothetical protein
MLPPTRWKLLAASLMLLAAATCGYQKMTTPSWETVTTVFAKSDKPYGGGAFRLHGNEVMTLKLAGPEVRFRVIDLDKGYDGAQAVPEEPWMDDSNERLNRSTVSFLRGTLAGGLTRSFQQPGQDMAWWYSKDWSTQYVSTDWMDYKLPEPKDGLSPHIAKLWRSRDGGKTWAQLMWPEHQNISQLLFLDPARGYAIGWGPRVWRTANGGQSWQEIKVPPLATNDRMPRKTFDAVNLGPDGMLRVAYYVERPSDIPASSIVSRLAWDQQDFERDTVLPGQVVVSLQAEPRETGRYSLYALSRLGLPRNWDDSNDKGKRTGAVSEWGSYRQPSVTQLHTFDQRYSLDGLSVGKQGIVLVYATDATRDGAPHDMTFFSRDYAKSWSEIDDGVGQGGWFDPDTNAQYSLYAYTLKKRVF